MAVFIFKYLFIENRIIFVEVGFALLFCASSASRNKSQRDQSEFSKSYARLLEKRPSTFASSAS